jgi:uncharacterized protein YlxW (UPF0749 family)
MDDHSGDPPSTPARPTRWRSLGERAAFLGGVAFLGLLLVVAGQSEPSRGGDRVGRRLELVELIARQQQRTAELAAEAAALEEQVARYQQALSDGGGGAPPSLQDDVAVAERLAGLTALAGPGVQVTLRDSTMALADAEGIDVNDLVIHEQDLQAVVNALWAGGAEAMSVNGQRLLSTSAIRCVGNILLLNGRVHPPPYEIHAIGSPVDLRAALDRDPTVALVRDAANQFGLGYEVVDAERLVIPAFEGPPAVDVALPEAAA